MHIFVWFITFYSKLIPSGVKNANNDYYIRKLCEYYIYIYMNTIHKLKKSIIKKSSKTYFHQ